jgi:di/tricarboxylate transporter
MGMPSGPARVLLAAPLAQDISDSLRYPARSGGSARLALSTFVGFGLMGNLFLTGNPMSLLLYGMLPPEVQARISWGTWFLAALPTHLVLFALLMGFVLFKYRPDGDGDVPLSTLALQRRVLGRMSRNEWVALATVVLLLVGFATQGFHHVDPAWVAVGAVGLLFLAGALDDAGLKHGVNLGFLLYLGVVLGFGRIFSEVQLDQWLSQNLGGVAGLVGGNQLVFILAVAAIATIFGVLFRPGPIGLLIWLALQGTATGLGINPWVLAMTILMPMMFWLYPQQNMMYLTAYYGANEQAFTHTQARPLAFVHAIASFIALAASVPVWKLMGLIGGP